MAIDVETPRSPGWWMKVLGAQLHERRFSPTWSATRTDRRDLRPPLELLGDYLRGDPPLPKVKQEWREPMRVFLRQARLNYALMSCQSVTHRLFPEGFATAVEDDRDGDPVAAELYEENDLGLRFTEGAEFMVGLGDGYTIVGPPAQGMSHALITTEDPRQVITAHHAGTGAVIAALKVFHDEWEARESAYLYLPGQVFVAHRPLRAARTSGAFTFAARSWEWDEDASGPLPASLGGRVPVVRMRNAGGVGDFEPHLDALDRINDVLFDVLTIGKYQAFRQRALKNLPEEDEQGNRIDYSDAFLADPGGLWRLPENVDVWESQVADLGPLRLVGKDAVAAFAAVSGTPLHYITPDAAQGSAEGAASMKENHLFRVMDRKRRCDAALRDVVSLAFAWEDDQARAKRSGIRTLWSPVEIHSLTERAQAASQAATTLSMDSIATDIWGYRPSDLDRLTKERGKDLMFVPPAASLGPSRG